MSLIPEIGGMRGRVPTAMMKFDAEMVLTVHLDVVSVDERRGPGKHGNSNMLKRFGNILLIGPLHDRPYVSHHVPAIHGCRFTRQQAERDQSGNLPVCMAQPNERLAGNTREIGAVPSHFPFLNDRHTFAQTIGRYCGHHSRDTGAYHNHIVIIGLCHTAPQLFSRQPF